MCPHGINTTPIIPWATKIGPERGTWPIRNAHFMVLAGNVGNMTSGQCVRIWSQKHAHCHCPLPYKELVAKPSWQKVVGRRQSRSLNDTGKLWIKPSRGQPNVWTFSYLSLFSPSANFCKTFGDLWIRYSQILRAFSNNMLIYYSKEPLFAPKRWATPIKQA